MWAIFFLESWKRKESYLAMRWGMSNFEVHTHQCLPSAATRALTPRPGTQSKEQPRPGFKGEHRKSKIDGKDELRELRRELRPGPPRPTRLHLATAEYSPIRKMAKLIFSQSVVITAIMAVVAGVAGIMLFRVCTWGLRRPRAASRHGHRCSARRRDSSLSAHDIWLAGGRASGRSHQWCGRASTRVSLAAHALRR